MPTRLTISKRGSITIPAAIRAAFGMTAKHEVLIEVTEQGILLRPALTVPLEIYTEKRIAEFASDDKAVGKLIRRRR